MQNNLNKIEFGLFLIAIAIAGIAIYYLGPSITGFVIKEFSYADDLNLVITSSGNYTWQLKDIGALKSAKLDGRVTTYGKARVYIESNGMRYLLFDSTSIGEAKKAKENESAALITGFAVEEDESKKGKGKGENKTESDEDKKKKNHKPDWIGDDEFVINGTIQINLSLYFTDEDRDSLLYSASEVEGLETAISNEIITITPTSDKDFNTTITFTASDGIDSKSETVNLIVIVEKEEFVQPNRAPIWNSDVATFVINGTTAINLSQYFIDEDNDSLSFSSGLVDNVTISIDNELMTLAPAEGYSGSALTSFAAFDGKNLTIKIVTLTVPEVITANITPINITPKINHAPKWASIIDSFVLNKTLAIDLLQYFNDEDNDTLTFSVSDAVDVSESISGSILTLTAALDNFNATITITASDGNLSAGKEIRLIIPLMPTPPITKTIAIGLAYKSGTIYDANDNGEESINGVVDLSVEGTKFNWDADASKLCTRWEVYNAGKESLTTFCNGYSECCAFIGLLPARSNWSEVYYSTFGKDDAGYDNIVSSQVLYYDVNLSIELNASLRAFSQAAAPKSDIYYSEWANLSVKFFKEETEFFNECIETCDLAGLNKSSYTLVFEIEDDAILRIDRIKYDLLVDVENNAPLLLKNFSTINVSKNKNATINLSQYFSDPDGDALGYGYYKADNITILFDGDIATILPDKGVEGARFTFITANDSEKTAASNVFMLNISEAKFKPKVEIGKPVKWQRKIIVDVGNVSSINLSLPETANNISIKILNETIVKELPDKKIKVVEDGKVKDKDIFEIGKRLENIKKKISILEEARQKDALKVAVDEAEFSLKEIDAKLNELYSKKSELESQLNQLSNANLITANAVAITETTINQTLPILFINESLTRNIEVEITYETEAPIAVENEINQYTKQIKVVSETSYEDVLSYTALNDAPQQAIKLYWIQNNEKILFENVNYLDENQNGLIDKIQWIIPHLSNQTFEVSITILNVQSYPTVGGNWTVAFNTTGTGNLTIYGYNGTSYAEIPDNSSTINDLEYLETRCNDTVLNTTIVCANGEQMPYEVYKLKKKIAEIKKRLNELNQTG